MVIDGEVIGALIALAAAGVQRGLLRTEQRRETARQVEAVRARILQGTEPVDLAEALKRLSDALMIEIAPSFDQASEALERMRQTIASMGIRADTFGASDLWRVYHESGAHHEDTGADSDDDPDTEPT